MGTDKAQLSINGHNFCHIIMKKTYKAGCKEVFFGRKKTHSHFHTADYEPWTEHHPLYGVWHGLIESLSNDLCIITPCDLPFVSIATYQRLIAQSVHNRPIDIIEKTTVARLFLHQKEKEPLSYAQQHRSVMSFVENEAYIVVSRR